MSDPSSTTEDPSALDAEVLGRHGFRFQPFAADTTERFVYSDPALDMPVGVVLRRLQTDGKPLLLVGEPGVGKSTQLVQLLSRGAATLNFCAFKGRSGATFASIEHAIRQQWGKTIERQAPSGSDEEVAEPRAPEKDSLAMILLTVARGEQRPVLVIDDAHLLTPGVLGGLLRLRREVNRHSDSTMGIVLAGLPTLNELTAEAQDSEMPAEPFTLIRLRPLMESQTDAYLRHRLQAAGAHDPSLLSGENAQAIYQESGGLPARINEAANRCLERLAAEPPEGSEIRLASVPLAGDARGSYWVVPAASGAIGVLIGALVTSLFFLSETRVAAPEHTQLAQQTAPFEGAAEQQPLPIQSGDEAQEDPKQQPSVPPLVDVVGLLPQRSTKTGIQPVTKVLNDIRPAPEHDPLPSGTPVAETVPVPELAEGATVPPEPEPTNVAASAPRMPPAGEPTVAVEPSTTLEEDPISVPAVPSLQAAEVSPAPPESLAQNLMTEVGGEAGATSSDPATDATRVSLPDGPLGPDWVRERPAGQFTIQIIAGVDLEALHQFANRVSMQADVAWFQTRRDNQDWYALVTGEYPDLASAQAAAAELPAPVRRNQPWIRTFGSVQQAMAPP